MQIQGFSIDDKSLVEYHQGQNMQRIRAYFGVKQEALAIDLGVSQAKISHIERQAVIEDKLLDKIAVLLGVSSELIRKFDIERAIQNLCNPQNTSEAAYNDSIAIQRRIEPMEKVIELYERLLKSEREKWELLIKHQEQIL